MARFAVCLLSLHFGVAATLFPSGRAVSLRGRFWSVMFPTGTAAVGGSNSSRRYVFKYHLEQLATQIQMEIRLAHYPPYCSKHDPIEHRFFPHVTRACQGVIFMTIELARAKMAETRTRRGLRTTVDILDGDYPIGEKVPAGYKKSMRIVFDDELPAWNYRAIPMKPGS